MKIIFIILLLLSPIYSNTKTSIDNKKELKKVDIKIVESLSVQDSVQLILSTKNLTPFIIELLIAQSKHESGNYKNSLSREHNNIFSRHYSVYDTLSLGGGACAEGHCNFARYSSIKNATTSQYYYLKRKNYSFNWKTSKEFAIELKKKGYYEDSVDNYAKAISKHIVNIRSSKK